MSERRPALLQHLDEELRDSELLRQAMTHRSAGRRHNERLEFLGDSVLNLIITEHLYRSHPEASEGELTRLRAHLVRGQTLAEIAAASELGSYLHLGSGERKSGGQRRASIMEDALEAIIGAVYELRGFEAARDFVHALYGERLQQLPAPETLKDPKTRLQEWLQARGLPLPEYTVLAVRGEPHRQVFHVQCRIPGHDLVTEAEGGSRRKAEQAAAEQALARLEGAAA